MGGLIIRILLEHLKPPEIMRRVAKVYICGTPFYGSHDTNDYNCEVQILPVILQTKKRITMQHKPMILTKGDIERIFRHFGKTLLYLAPSFVIEQMYPENYTSDMQLGEHTKMTMYELIEMRNVHSDLSKYEFHTPVEYNFFFNVSRKIDVTHTMDKNLMKHISRQDGETHLKRIKYLPENQKFWEVTRTFDSDGLVLSCRKMPVNANTWFDHTLATHSLLMNSRQLSEIIKST